MVDYRKNAVLAACDDRLDPWRVSNEWLYTLCSEHRDHRDNAATAAKLLVIGRVYAATLERGRGKAPGAELDSDAFYLDVAAPALRSSELDARLDRLKELALEEAVVPEILRTHGYLERLLRRLSGRTKRSLASKYLHFHAPHLFFIYDTRASVALRSGTPSRRSAVVPRGADPRYATFVARALELRNHIEQRFGRRLSPRQLDRLLLHSARSAAG